MLKYSGPLIIVAEIAPARHFYEHVLGQKVKFDFGENVAFAGDFSLHRQAHFQALLGAAAPAPPARPVWPGELCFETDELEALEQRLQQAQVEFVHPIQEQPWGQRVMRLYDPAGHLLEIGETMEAAVWRLYQQGASAAQISQKSGLPMEFVEQAIQQQGRPAAAG